MILHPDFPYPLYLVISEKNCLHLPWPNVLEEAILGGVDIVQLREKNCTDDDFLAKAKIAKSITDKYEIPLIINDNIHVAIEVDAYGVHVGNSDISPTQVRTLLGTKACIGYSLEYWQQLDTADSICANYLAASPVFSTSTKENTVTEWGLEGISRIRQYSGKPLVGIGNIHLNNVQDIVKAGAHSIAVVSEICAARDPRTAAQQLKAALQSDY